MKVGNLQSMTKSSLIRVVFWQNCLSPHQLPYIVHLIDDLRVDEVVVIAGRTVSDARKKMGWQIETFEGLDKCKVYISPHDGIIESLLSERTDDSHHLFSGIRADDFVFKCLCMSMKYNLHRGMITERPNTYNFKWNIKNGKPYWMHRLRFFIQDRKYAKCMEYVFAIGSGADTYFKSLGLGWKVYPFCYCTKHVSRYSNVPHSLPQFIFIGSLEPWKNPISIVKAFSHLKCGVMKFLGDGSMRKVLQNEISKYTLQDYIHILGTIPRQQISSYLSNADVLILPSLYDGWGAVVNEALHAGCFVICSDACGSCALLKNNSKLGLVFKTGSDTSLVDCMKYVNIHLNEIRTNREFRIKWAETHIGGRTIAKYLVDCLYS